MRGKTIMHFPIIGLRNLIGLALIGVAGGLNPSQSCDIQKLMMQFRIKPEASNALIVQRRFGKAPILELTDPVAFGMSRAPTETKVAQESRKRKDSNYQLRKVEEWRTASMQHDPGSQDSAALTIGGWDERDLELVIELVTKLASQPVKTARRTLARVSIRRALRLTDQEVRTGDLNRILKRGALLHTDIALLELETKGNLNTSTPVLAFEDGRVGVLPRMLHWEFARRLLDSVSPSPSRDPIVREWYIATTAHMERHRLLAYAEQNLENALKIFPSDGRILFYSGVLHETYASSSNQNVLLPPQLLPTYGSRESELKRARQFFQKSVKVNPNSAETHLRLGRVLGLLGNHRQAVAELQRAAVSIKDTQLLYYASLYLGYEFAMLSRRSEAREQYERAAMLYPTAQSPLFALSRLADASGDVAGAFLAIQRVFNLPCTDFWKDDPWWTYDLSPVRDADVLVGKMHQMFGELPR
jgi:tetratricopeptide (TPR) repeat protein